MFPKQLTLFFSPFKIIPSLVLVGALFLLTIKPAFAQNRAIDSIANLIKLHPAEDDTRATLLFAQAANYLNIDPRKSLAFANQMLAFQQKIKQRKIIAAAHRLKGTADFFLANYSDAVTSLETALRLDKEIKHEFGIASDLSMIGMVHLSRSNFYEALNYFQQSLSIFEHLKGQENDVNILYANIGIIQIQLRNYSKALTIFNKAIEAYRFRNDKRGEAAALTNIGIIYSKQHRYNDAVRYAERSRKISDSINDKYAYARETGNLAGYYIKLRQYDLSLSYSLRAIELNKVISNKKSIGFNLQNAAEAYYKKHDFTLAKSYGLRALQIGQELKVIEIQQDASEGLSKVYESIKMPDSALFYFRQFTTLTDSINNTEKREELTRLGLQYDFDKKETTYKQQQQLAVQQLQQQKLQLALNEAELQKGIQLRGLQQAQLQNEQLLAAENKKQLIISKNREKLQASRVKALSQQQKLNKLEMNQLWLYGILAVVVLISILVFLVNLYRIRQLRFKNTLENEQAKQNEISLKYQYQLSESELRAIRSQMNPHFIFNVLNSIESYIMENDKKTASRLIQKFASLSRLILENSTKSLVTADKEWKTLMIYTELEAMRYANAFTYEFIVEKDIQLQTLLLPPMLIQPLIENAILHGLIPSTQEDNRLVVTLKQSGKGICILVEDNGVGLNHAPKQLNFNTAKEKSMGLDSIRERIDIINLQYPGTASFHFGKGTDGRGILAQLCLPNFTAAPTQ